MKYSIIIPTLNEEEGIAKVLCAIPKEILSAGEVLVMDSSTDMTPEIAVRLGAIVIRPAGKGKGNAMRDGVRHAQGDILIFMDGDGTDPPQQIPKLIKKLEYFDIVLGARSVDLEADEHYKYIGRIWQSLVMPVLGKAGLKIKGDALAGFRVMRKNTWNKLNLEATDFLIETEMNVKALKLGMRIGEVPIPHLKRAGGLLKSKFLRSPDQWVKIIKYVLKQKFKDNFDKYIHYGKPLI